jgi:hypothetical protein
MLLLHMDSDVPPIAGKVDCGRGHHYSRIAREWPRDGRLQEASTVVVARGVCAAGFFIPGNRPIRRSMRTR